MAKGPVLIDLEASEAPAPSVADAPPVPDLVETASPDGRAMQMASKLAARKPSRLVRWFWGLAMAVLGAVISVAAWDFANGMIARNPLLGYAVAAVLAVFVAVVLILALREVMAVARLGRIDTLRLKASAAREAQDLSEARGVVRSVTRLYGNRPETKWGRDRVAELQGDQLDAGGLLDMVEAELMSPLDKAATLEVQAAARQVATVTALVPMAFADVAAALSGNLRMIRRVAEIYGGRPGGLSNWRLMRSVMTHLVATGAVAVGDDMLEPILGGGLLGKLSRRFGEGVVNGALTARVGVAAMEVCRPLPFSDRHRPKTRKLVGAALSGLFSKGAG